MSTEELIQRVEHLEKLVASMQPKNEKWVGASVVTSKTGWNNEALRKARRNGSIKYKIVKQGTGGRNSYRYLLSSIVKSDGYSFSF